MSDAIVKWDARSAKFVDRQVRDGKWRVEIIPKEITGTPRDMHVFRAPRAGAGVGHPPESPDLPEDAGDLRESLLVPHPGR